MDEIATAFAKLAGVRKAIGGALETVSLPHKQPIRNFKPSEVERYFYATATQLEELVSQLPHLYADFVTDSYEPDVAMAPGASEPKWFSREQLQALARDIDQIFEIRANSELAQPTPPKSATNRVFISHGRAKDWYEIQSYIERDLGYGTLELAQEPNLGRTVLQKLEQETDKCDFAVIVMTGDDIDGSGNARARENVLHEIGYCQAKYGLSAVCLLHEEGTNIPSNIHGLVYIPFTKSNVAATLGALTRELGSFYSRPLQKTDRG